ncbi:RING/U-box superfamily protein [Actinidia rufa]|uniref:RING/U-box superfamily protein n=1 Tax=Actinidia rufa TaxID=165716 RepID=A0A7J0DK19_9ERIC|nr:RING/U-box superfamily protein [Actinidia rufa]GFZ05568.1 RING/U-box superfamily protein [Actinidia rufa]
MAIRSDPRKILESHTIADPPASTGSAESASDGETGSSVAEAPEIGRLGKHHSSDKSVAGGGVIIGGLATAIFAAVYCYIRVTRRRDTEKI